MKKKILSNMRDSNENILRSTQTEWLNVWFSMCSDVEKNGENVQTSTI